MSASKEDILVGQLLVLLLQCFDRRVSGSELFLDVFQFVDVFFEAYDVVVVGVGLTRRQSPLPSFVSADVAQAMLTKVTLTRLPVFLAIGTLKRLTLIIYFGGYT